MTCLKANRSFLCIKGEIFSSSLREILNSSCEFGLSSRHSFVDRIRIKHYFNSSRITFESYFILKNRHLFEIRRSLRQHINLF